MHACGVFAFMCLVWRAFYVLWTLIGHVHALEVEDQRNLLLFISPFPPFSKVAKDQATVPDPL